MSSALATVSHCDRYVQAVGHTLQFSFDAMAGIRTLSRRKEGDWLLVCRPGQMPDTIEALCVDTDTAQVLARQSGSSTKAAQLTAATLAAAMLAPLNGGAPCRPAFVLAPIRQRPPLQKLYASLGIMFESDSNEAIDEYLRDLEGGGAEPDDVREVVAPEGDAAVVGSILRFRVELTGTSPLVWRSFEVDASTTLQSLHNTLQTVMGWEDAHLYELKHDGASYVTRPERRGERPVRSTKLSELKLRKNSIMQYIYDWGDNWSHRLVVEEVRPAGSGDKVPRCLSGARACPPEECGGVWRYNQLVAQLASGQVDDDDDGWLDDLDPTIFDLAGVNKNLKSR